MVLIATGGNGKTGSASKSVNVHSPTPSLIVYDEDRKCSLSTGGASQPGSDCAFSVYSNCLVTNPEAEWGNYTVSATMVHKKSGYTKACNSYCSYYYFGSWTVTCSVKNENGVTVLTSKSKDIMISSQ